MFHPASPSSLSSSPTSQSTCPSSPDVRTTPPRAKDVFPTPATSPSPKSPPALPTKLSIALDDARARFQRLSADNDAAAATYVAARRKHSRIERQWLTLEGKFKAQYDVPIGPDKDKNWIPAQRLTDLREDYYASVDAFDLAEHNEKVRIARLRDARERYDRLKEQVKVEAEEASREALRRQRSCSFSSYPEDDLDSAYGDDQLPHADETEPYHAIKPTTAVDALEPPSGRSRTKRTTTRTADDLDFEQTCSVM